MTHIENDVIMAQQWCKRLNDGVHWRLKIICDDTDNVAFAFSSNREHSSSWNQLQIGLLLTLEYHSINIQQKRKLFQSVDATVYTAWWVLESWSPWLPWRRKGWFTWATWVQQEKILWLKHQNFTVYVTTLQRKRYVWKKVMVYITFQCFQSPVPSTIILYEKTMCPKILISFYKISFQVPPSSKFLFWFPGIKHGSSTCQKSCQQHQSCPRCHQRMKLLLRMFWEPAVSSLSRYQHLILISQLWTEQFYGMRVKKQMSHWFRWCLLPMCLLYQKKCWNWWPANIGRMNHVVRWLLMQRFTNRLYRILEMLLTILQRIFFTIIIISV